MRIAWIKINVDGTKIVCERNGHTLCHTDNNIKCIYSPECAEKGCKELLVPNDYTGNSTQYNYVEQDGKIVLAGLKDDIKAEIQIQTDKSRIASLKKRMSDYNDKEVGDWKMAKYSEYIANGLETPFDINVYHAAREAIRVEINILEDKYINI